MRLKIGYLFQFCSKQPACSKGRLFDCQYFDADSTVCLSTDPSRKYNWIEFEDGTVLGTRDQCPSKFTSRQLTTRSNVLNVMVERKSGSKL